MSWSTNPIAPERKTGDGWFTVDTVPARTVGTGWFHALEKVGVFNSAGTLHITPRQTYRVDASFSGGGALGLPVSAPKYVLGVVFSGLGLPFVEVARSTDFGALGFAAEGSLQVVVHDGLTAIVGPGIAISATFSSGGLLGVVHDDGLTADVHPGTPAGAPVPVGASFVGCGSLSAQAYLGDGLICAVYPVTVAVGSVGFAGSATGSLNVGVVQQVDGLVASVYGGS